MSNKQFWIRFKKNTSVGMIKGNNIDLLLRKLHDLKVDSFSIYNDQQGFHSVTQLEYLVCHWNDVYLSKQGIPSVVFENGVIVE